MLIYAVPTYRVSKESLESGWKERASRLQALPCLMGHSMTKSALQNPSTASG